MSATWKPHEKHGRLTKQSDLPDTVFAFPKQRKEPLTDARHVRNSVARFDQVTGVSDVRSCVGFCQHQESRQILWRQSLGSVVARSRCTPATKPKTGGRQSRRHAAAQEKTILGQQVLVLYLFCTNVQLRISFARVSFRREHKK